MLSDIIYFRSRNNRKNLFKNFIYLSCIGYGPAPINTAADNAAPPPHNSKLEKTLTQLLHLDNRRFEKRARESHRVSLSLSLSLSLSRSRSRSRLAGNGGELSAVRSSAAPVAPTMAALWAGLVTGRGRIVSHCPGRVRVVCPRPRPRPQAFVFQTQLNTPNQTPLKLHIKLNDFIRLFNSVAITPRCTTAPNRPIYSPIHSQSTLTLSNQRNKSPDLKYVLQMNSIRLTKSEPKLHTRKE